ncbi:unnamed protein product, partial [Vitis vinifera]|uniref:Uncharacterized protein n=1 Tax=Vitis vinifera TaxID=29760 RepID=D7T6B2_VITVI
MEKEYANQEVMLQALVLDFSRIDHITLNIFVSIRPSLPHGYPTHDFPALCELR